MSAVILSEVLHRTRSHPLQVDGTENEHEKLDVEGFPTLLLFPAGKNGTFVTFEGDYRGLKVRYRHILKLKTTTNESNVVILLHPPLHSPSCSLSLAGQHTNHQVNNIQL